MRLLITAVVMLLMTSGLSQAANLPSASLAAITAALTSGRPTLVDFGSNSCASCKKMAPFLSELEKEYRNRANVLFVDVRTDEKTASAYRVQMIPTQVFFNSQGKEVKRHIGFLEKQELIKDLKAAGLK